MPTECIPDLFGFEPVEGREVVAAFDAGMITSDAGALLLRATDRAIKMMERFASCFHDVRRAELIEHEVATPPKPTKLAGFLWSGIELESACLYAQHCHHARRGGS